MSNFCSEETAIYQKLVFNQTEAGSPASKQVDSPVHEVPEIYWAMNLRHAKPDASKWRCIWPAYRRSKRGLATTSFSSLGLTVIASCRWHNWCSSSAARPLTSWGRHNDCPTKPVWQTIDRRDGRSRTITPLVRNHSQTYLAK